jgi:hypothetical protein
MNAEPEPAGASPQTEGRPRRGPTRFAYASGTRPLDGYTIKRGIGAGGFGDVYYATSDAGKEVALKRIQRNLDVELRGVSQCLNLKHPNLVDLYDIRHDDDDQAWVVMEYVAGESLQDVIERHPQGMPEDQVLHWFEGIARGVAYLHDHGIVHRDLKPGNIFLDQGVVKIGDYGLSKFISCSRRSGQTESVGTFHYMAPEIGLGRYGKEIDIYALGILLYEMLSGHVPFEGESSQEIIMKHLTMPPNLANIPAPYRGVIGRAMAKDPAERFQSADEMRRAVVPQHGEPGVGASFGGATRSTPPPPPPWGSARGFCARAAAFKPTNRAWHEARDWARRNPEEPIAAAVQQRVSYFRAWWRQQSSTARAALAVVTALAVLINLGWLLPSLFGVGAVYLGYYVIWYLINHWPCRSGPSPNSPLGSAVPHGVKGNFVGPPPIPTTTPPDSPAPPAPRGAQRRLGPSRQQVNEAMRDALAQKTFAQRASELTGSMLMAALVATVVGLVGTVASSQNLEGGLHGWGPVFAWLVISSVVASWLILLFGKLWEGASGDQALRRFWLAVAGMALGTFAGVLAQALVLEPTYLLAPWSNVQNSPVGDLRGLYSVTGQPQTLAYAGYFGGLFLSLRWWLGADPLRSARLNLFTTAGTIVMGLLWYFFVPIPHGFMVAATTAVAVQLAAPWVPPRRRQAFKQSIVAS